ncbi:MAG: hypothetical protein V3573_09610 [Desulfovibrionaceae bacterium]
MTSIKWGPSSLIDGFGFGIEPATSAGDREQGSLPGIKSARERGEEYQRSRTTLTLRRGGDALADGLAARVERLTNAVVAFSWPDAAQDRTVARNPDLAGKAFGLLADNPSPYHKYFSRGLEKQQAVSLDAGEYVFELRHGSDTDSLSLDVEADWTNQDLLQAVADAVNQSELPVQAELVEQYAPEHHQYGQVATGLSLALGVNASLAEQDVGLRDTSGHLLASLNLRETAVPVGPAAIARRELTGLSTYSPSTFASSSFDPNAAASLSAGEYTFGYTFGPRTGTFSVTVEQDDTWSMVLRRFANSADSAQSDFSVRETDRSRRSEFLTEEQWGDLEMQGVGLEIVATRPKVGERLKLSGEDEDSAAALAVLGLNRTARPGGDARLAVDGRERTRAPGMFAEDQGRVLVSLEATFGESLTLSVVETLQELTDGLNDITQAYNDLRSWLTPNAGYFEPGLAEKWRAPLADLATDLKETGLREMGGEGLLWFEHDVFFRAVGSAPDNTRALLLDAELGLLPRWEALGREMLAQPATQALADVSALPDPYLPDLTPRTEVELEKKSRLLDILDEQAPDFSLPLGKGLVDRSG